MSAAVEEVVYTPESSVLRPWELARQMLRDLRASRALAWRLMLRDIRVQYRRSMLGAAWTFIPAAATAAILTLASRARILNVGDTAIPYPAYVVLSMTLWQAFLDGLNGPVLALSAESRLLARFNVAPEAVVLSKVGEGLFNCGVRSVLTAALFLWFGIALGWSALLAPLGALALVVFGTALGLFLAPLSVLYQDVSKSLPIVASVWFILTPVVYPAPGTGVFSWIVRLNPVTPLLATTRDLVTGQPLVHLPAFAATVLAAGVLLGAGWVIYRLAMPIVIERARF